MEGHHSALRADVGENPRVHRSAADRLREDGAQGDAV